MFELSTFSKGRATAGICLGFVFLFVFLAAPCGILVPHVGSTVVFFVVVVLTVLGLSCRTWAFSSCSEQWLLFVVVRGLPIEVASPVVEQGLQAHGLQ